MDRRDFILTTGKAGLILFMDGDPINDAIAGDPSPITEKKFVAPPVSAYPQVLWFWMNGNISRKGITRDLEAMKEVGIGGVLNFDAGTGIPKGPVNYLDKEWLE